MTASKPEPNHSNFTATPVSKKIPQRGSKAREACGKEQDKNQKVLKGNVVSAKVRKAVLIGVVGIMYLLMLWPPLASALVQVCNHTNDIMQR